MPRQADTIVADILKDKPQLAGNSTSKTEDCGLGLSLTSSEALKSSPSVGCHSLPEQESPPRKWKVSFVRFGPLSGIFCMMVAAASIVASLGILSGSNNQEIQTWKTPPSTYLAIFTALANMSMRYAAMQGVLIAWWTRALKGSCLSELHWDWRSGSSLRGALTAGRHMGLLGLACLFSVIVVVDGPLLQRASTVVTGPTPMIPLMLNITMAPEIPRGYTGTWGTADEMGLPGSHSSPSWNDTVPTPDGTAPNNILTYAYPALLNLQISKVWYDTVPLKGVVHGCPGSCQTKILAPALFPTKCKSHTVRNTYVEAYNTTAIIKEWNAPPLDTDTFMISTTLVVQDNKEKIALTTGFTTRHSSDTNPNHCNCTFTYTTCTLEAGIAEYAVFIQDDAIDMNSLGAPKFVALSNNTSVDPNRDAIAGGGHPATLGGIVTWIWTHWETFVSYYETKGLRGGINAVANPAISRYQNEADPNCASFKDPQADVMASINQLMIYTGAIAAKDMLNGGRSPKMDPGMPSQTTVTGYPSGQTDLYHTEYSFFVAAALVEFVCILLIAPTYWGWWRIGRPVSFSPLEMAKAFDSPLLSHCFSNSSGRDLANNTRGYQVKYGVRAADPAGTISKLGFGLEAQAVAQPQNGKQFDV